MERLIELEGCFNFRDLGGYPTGDGRRVRWRMLFRSDALHHLTPEDVRRLRSGLGIGDIVDLRSTHELSLDGRGLLDAEDIRFHHLPLFDGQRSADDPPPPMGSLAEMYLGMAEYGKDPIGRVLTTLARTGSPAVYHCAAGKDRTGIISALLLGLLGVRDEIIVADYAATRENLDAIVDRLTNTPGYQRIFDDLPRDTLHAEPETMMALLTGLRDRYDGVPGYAREAGVSEADIEQLRDRVLER